MNLAPRKLFNSCGAAIVIAGTAPDGEAPAGTGVASAGDGVSAGVVRPAGTDGDGQATRQPVRRGLARPEFTVPGRRAGRELNVPGLQAGRASKHCPRGYADLLPWPQACSKTIGFALVREAEGALRIAVRREALVPHPGGAGLSVEPDWDGKREGAVCQAGGRRRHRAGASRERDGFRIERRVAGRTNQP